MNYNTILVVDFETGSRNPRTTQPIQLASVAIDGRKLEIIPNSIFQSYIRPYLMSCNEYGLDSLQEEALNVNKITMEQLINAPTIEVVWPQFCDYVNQYNSKKNKFTAPIFAGYNSFRFDEIIINRICGGQKNYSQCEKEPYKLGPWDEEQKLFHPRDSIDIMKYVWLFTENNQDVKSISFDSVREMFGITKTAAHNAISDVISCAFLLIRFLKLARRINLRPKHCFDEENKQIEEMMKQYVGTQH